MQEIGLGHDPDDLVAIDDRQAADLVLAIYGRRPADSAGAIVRGGADMTSEIFALEEDLLLQRRFPSRSRATRMRSR
jgi:hypothetical protein